MKYLLKYIFFLAIALPLCGSASSGSPADIKRGEFQTLQKKIASGAFKQAEAQVAFQQLISKMTPQDKVTYKGIIAEVVQAAQKQGIILPTDDKQLPTQTLQLPPLKQSYGEQVTTKPPEKVVSQKPAVPQQPKQKPSLPPSGGKKPQEELEKPKEAQRPQDLGHKMPADAVGDLPAPAQLRLPEARFNELKNKLKELRKNYKVLSVNELDRAMREIKAGFGKVSMPLYMEKMLEKIEAFRNQLADHLKAITALGTKLVDQELPVLKNRLTDPKVVKGLLNTVEALQVDIQFYMVYYDHNKTIQMAVYNAQKNLRNSLYAVIQESMRQAAQLKNNSTLYELIKKYKWLMDEYPFYSEKRLKRLMEQRQAESLKNELSELQKIVQTKKEESFKRELRKKEKLMREQLEELKKKEEINKLTVKEEQNAQLLEKLEMNGYYVTLSVAELDKQLASIETDLLSEQQQNRYNTVYDYLEYESETFDTFKELEARLQEAQKFIKQNISDIDATKKHFEILKIIEKVCQGDLETAQTFGKNSWLGKQLTEKIAIIKTLLASLESKWIELEAKALEKQDEELEQLEKTTQVSETPAITLPTDDEFDALVERARDVIVQNTADIDTVYRQLRDLDKLDDKYKAALSTTKDSLAAKNLQRKRNTLQALITVLDKKELELEKLEAEPMNPEKQQHRKELNTAEELKEMEVYSAKFEAKKLGPIITDVKFPQSLTTPTFISKPQTGSAKINAESEQREKELAQQGLEKWRSYDR